MIIVLKKIDVHGPTNAIHRGFVFFFGDRLLSAQPHAICLIAVIAPD